MFQRLKFLTRAAPKWGPALRKHRRMWLANHGSEYGDYFVESVAQQQIRPESDEDIEKKNIEMVQANGVDESECKPVQR